MKPFDPDIVDLANAALAAHRAGQTDIASQVTMPMNMFIRLLTTAQGNMDDAVQYHAQHATEKSMREFAEKDLGRFRKIIGRIFWLGGK